MRLILAGFLCTFISSCASLRPASKAYDAAADFEAFWEAFEKHYALFDVKGVQWDRSYAQYRPMLTAQTNLQELVKILGQMADPLRDGHITISNDDGILYKGNRRSAFRELIRGKEPKFWSMVHQTLNEQGFGAIQGIGPKYKEESLFYAGPTANIGYIRITRCFGTVASLYDDAEEAKDLVEMLRLWDSLLVAFQPKEKLVVDLRGNGGGHGGREMASRLLTARTTTHSITTRDTGTGFMEPTPVYLEPNSGTRFLKDVVVLTSDRTASSAEDFALSLVEQPHVRLVGKPTAGMFSDMYNLTLPSGLDVTLSHQRYLNRQGRVLEDKGVPVHVAVANSAADLEKGPDPVVLKALQL